MPHTHKACQKKREDAYPNKVCLMSPRHDKKRKKKKNIAHTKKILQGREKSYKGVFIHHPPKIPTHLHILIKIYDLFLLWIQSLTWQNMRTKFAIISSIPTDPPKRSH